MGKFEVGQRVWRKIVFFSGVEYRECTILEVMPDKWWWRNKHYLVKTKYFTRPDDIEVASERTFLPITS